MACPYSSDDIHSLVNSTVVAIDKEKHSSFAVRWAVDHLFNMILNSVMILVHVRLKNSNHGGNFDDGDLNQLFVPYRGYCARKGVFLVDFVVADTVFSYVVLDLVNNLVLGAFVLGSFSRCFFFSSLHLVQSRVVASSVVFCSVYFFSVCVIFQCSVPSSRPVPSPLAPPLVPSCVFFFPFFFAGADDVLSRVRRRAGSNPVAASYSHDRAGFNPVREVYKIPINGSLDFNYGFSQGAFQRNSTLRSSFSDESSGVFCVMVLVSLSFRAGMFFFVGGSGSSDESVSQSTRDIEAEMRRLKLELKQTMDMYSSACKEALTAKRKANELNQWKMEEARRFEEARLSEEAALAVAEMEKAKCRAALEAAEKAQRMAELEGQRRKQAEMKAVSESQEKDRAVSALVHNDVRYRKYCIDEIEVATERFANHRKIGEGGYGPVYHGALDHTPVAIKVLRPDAAQGKKQFQQEVEVLCCIRHPHMVLLLGACPEYGCLVYEFMNYGSLEDRLFRKGNSPPIPWRNRFKIAAGIAIGLLFLHQTKPEPLVHRDLKPANILLDRNFVCKISDVGLARLVPPSVANSVTQYHMTSAAGTFCYIDPEYQQTGELGTKSDIYSLGVLLLQIITARPPMGLTHHIDRAIQKGTFAELLDPTVPDWPVEEAMQFAKLALKCCELRKKDRPELGLTIMPELARLRDLRTNGGQVGDLPVTGTSE
uniref:RING-type E3 ubiquitin transferase n=1 Tax=Camellia sinensis TaxID=4442 RepID=B3VCC3_CAMSI|nr:calcium-dependent protein kinase [Camellia sinensis]